MTQGVFVEADPRNATACGLFYDRACAWPETLRLAQFAHLLNVGIEVVGLIRDQRFADVHCGLGGILAHAFFQVGEHYVINAFLAIVAGSAKAGVHTRKGLDFQGDVLYDVAHPRALIYPHEEPAFAVLRAAVRHHGREHRLQPVPKAGHNVSGLFLHVFEVEHHHDELVTFHRPVVGATHGVYFSDFHGFKVVLG